MFLTDRRVFVKLKLINTLFYPPLTRGSSCIFALSSMIVSANLGLETSLPFKRTTEQNSTLSSVFKRDAMVMFSDHCTCFSFTSIKRLCHTIFFQNFQDFRKINAKAFHGFKGGYAVIVPSASLIYGIFEKFILFFSFFP